MVNIKTFTVLSNYTSQIQNARAGHYITGTNFFAQIMTSNLNQVIVQSLCSSSYLDRGSGTCVAVGASCPAGTANQSLYETCQCASGEYYSADMKSCQACPSGCDCLMNSGLCSDTPGWKNLVKACATNAYLAVSYCGICKYPCSSCNVSSTNCQSCYGSNRDINNGCACRSGYYEANQPSCVGNYLLERREEGTMFVTV